MFNFVFGKLNPPAVRNMPACLFEGAVVVIDRWKLISVCSKPETLGWQPQQKAWLY